MSEPQTCPRRGEGGAGSFLPGPDRWDTGRWSTNEESVRLQHLAEDTAGLARHNAMNALRNEPPITMEEYTTKWHIRGPSNDLWFWSWGPPRTCSYCGGIHPEDALRLLGDDWEVDGTTKGYKKYLNPPGTNQKHAALIRSLQDKNKEPFQCVPSVWSPTPPVKVYVQHFTAEHIDQWNAIVDGRKK